MVTFVVAVYNVLTFVNDKNFWTCYILNETGAVAACKQRWPNLSKLEKNSIKYQGDKS